MTSSTHADGGSRYFELGLSYCSGDPTAQNLVLAHKWLNLAAIAGSEEARMVRAEVARDMSPEQIATAQRLAREHLKQTIH
jgi:TPR repeat protein